MENRHTHNQSQCPECDAAEHAKPAQIDEIVDGLMAEWDGMITKMGDKLIEKAKKAGKDVLEQLKTEK